MQIRMLREIDRMFEGVPQTRKTLEAKEEMLQNLMEKYNDLIAQGKNEEAAFNIAIASVGDISDLLAELNQPIPKVATFDEDETDSVYAEAGYGMPEPYNRHSRAMIVSVSVMLYILSPIALILVGGKFGMVILFAMIAMATGLLIYNGINSGAGNKQAAPAAQEGTEAEGGKLTPAQKRFLSSISGALWMVTVALYFVISFATGAWHISWIIFLIAGAANSVLRAFIDLYRGR